MTVADAPDEEVAHLRAQVAHLQRALDNRPPLEHAVGVLMALQACDAETAWQTLRFISNTTHRKARDVADVLVAMVAGRAPLPPDVADVMRDVIGPPRQR